MAIKVGTEDKKKVYLASGPRCGYAHPAGAFPVADLRPFARTASGAARQVATVARPATTTAASPGKTRLRRLMPTRRQRSAAWPRLTLRCIRRSCVRPSRSSTRAMGETSSPSSPLPRKYPNRSLLYARRTSIPDLRRPRHRRPSTWASMAMRQREPARNRFFCCMEMTSSLLRRGMWSTGVIA